MPRRLLLAAVCLALLAGLLEPAAGSAMTAPCFPGSSVTCHAWYAKVLRRRGDGDTIFAHVLGAGGFSGYRRVRFAGINTQEMSRYSTIYSRQRGECHSIAATRNLWRMLAKAHWRVRLTALHASSHSGSRLRRAVSAKIGGRWVDVERAQLESGLAVWLPNGIEWPENREYNRLSQVAAAKGVGLWNPRGCGGGPSPDARLQVLAAWNSNTGDSRDLNGEAMIVRNLGGSDVSLRGWVIRNGGAVRYHFPRGAVVRAHDQVVVHSGHGRDDGHDFYFGLNAPYLDNIGLDGHHLASGVYLFDPKGNIRAHQIYPCMVDCQAALGGKLSLFVQPRGTEYVEIANVSAQPVDLEGYRVQLSWLGYWFTAPTLLDPGARVRIYVDSPQYARQAGVLTRSWNLHTHLLRDGDGAVSLATFDDIRLDCFSWGGGSCSDLP